MMEELNYTIISKDMVWQWYYDPCKGKHFRELLGKDAEMFIRILETGKQVYIEDIISPSKQIS
jgi:hypothetical protein